MNKTGLNARVEHDQSHKFYGNSAFAVYLLTVLLGILTLAIIDTLLNRYYGADGSIPTFMPNDKPGDIFQSVCSKPVIGSHYFGDFQSEYCRQQGATPYPSDAPSLYLPGFYVLSSFIAVFTSVASSWLVTTVLSVLILVASIKSHLMGKGHIFALIVLIATFNPFWQALDRGNFTWLLGVGFIILGVKSESRLERSWLFAIAISFKMQLAPFAVVLLCGGTIRDKWRSLAHFASIFTLLNFVIPLLGWRDFNQFYPNYFRGLRTIRPIDKAYGFRSIIDIASRLNWSIWFWVFFLLFSVGLTMCLVFTNETDLRLDRRNPSEDIVLITLSVASVIVLLSPLSFVYSLLVFLIPIVLIVGMKSGVRLIHKVQLVLLTICTLPNTISLDSFIARQMRTPAEETISYPSLGNLIPSVLLPSVAVSAVIIGCIDFRRRQVMK